MSGSDGIELCPHPPSQICYDDREGTEVCTKCGLVLGALLLGGSETKPKEESAPGPDERVYFELIADLAHAAMIHPSIVAAARRRVKSFRAWKEINLTAFSHPEVAACAIYAASVDENAHYTIKG